MKKIIVLTFAIVLLCSFVATGQDRDKVKIEVTGFDNNQQALLFISKYASQKAPDAWRLVRSNPELIMKVTAKTRILRTWTEIDSNAANRNNMLRTIDRQSQRAVRRIPYRAGKGWVRIGAQIGRDIAVSKYVDNKYVVEKFRMQEVVSTVEISVYDPKTREVLSSSIGVNDIVVRSMRVYGQEPVTVLANGDLSQVVDSTENLGNQYRFLLQLSAFMESQKPENNITN